MKNSVLIKNIIATTIAALAYLILASLAPAAEIMAESSAAQTFVELSLGNL